MILKRFTGPWTASKLRDFETCRLMALLKHVEKRSEPSSPALERGNRVHRSLEQYLLQPRLAVPEEVGSATMAAQLAKLKKQKPIVEKLWAHDREWKPLANGFDSAAWLRGKTDAFIAARKSVRVIDFKTGKIYPENTDQVRLYGTLGLIRAFGRVKNLLKHATAMLELWYVDQQVIKEYELAGSEVEEAISDFDRRALRMYDEKQWPAEPGDHCRWCSFGRSRGGPCKFG